MIFIGKPGKDLSHPKNYRPITLLNLIGKAFGKLVNARLVQYLDQGYSNPLQYGFRRGRGCESSLALMYEYMCRRMSHQNNHKVSVVSRDIAGAFDRVWHEKLIPLFTEINLDQLFVKLLASFLSNREIRIKIKNFIGPPFTPEAGVPQGAPDSPDIFNISTLPLNDLTQTANTYMPWYADDLHMIVATECSKGNKTFHPAHLTKAIQEQDRFERTRGIMTCTEKSVITPIGRISKEEHLQYPQFDNIIKYKYLPKGESTKILGLNITRTSWTVKHVEEIATKANSIVSLMYAARDIAQAERIYLAKTLIVPSLTYPCTPLNTCSAASFSKLQTVLNRAMRFAFNVRYPEMPTARSLLERAKIEPINKIIHKRASNIWNKIDQGIAGDIDTYNNIKSIPLSKPHSWFPSSLERTTLGEPPPIYTTTDRANHLVKAYYNH